MTYQLNIFHSILRPGATYTCVKPWVNEMGYKWKPGEKIVIEIVGLNHCQVRVPKEKQHFHLLMEKVVENFEEVAA
jgi:hypothetical protein